MYPVFLNLFYDEGSVLARKSIYACVGKVHEHEDMKQARATPTATVA
jgi:hypothetical protein